MQMGTVPGSIDGNSRNNFNNATKKSSNVNGAFSLELAKQQSALTETPSQNFQ